ncbi:MAG: helix-turn-helix transcriptional regulator [Beijerinckiaceae bacterium]
MPKILLSRRLIREHEMAALLSKSLSSMRRLRIAGGGPPFIRVGGSIRYDLAAFEKFLALNNRETQARKSSPHETTEI